MNDTKSNLPRCRGWQESGGGGTGSLSSPSSPSTSHIYWLIIEGSLETSPHRPQQDRWGHSDGWGMESGHRLPHRTAAMEAAHSRGSS